MSKDSQYSDDPDVQLMLAFQRGDPKAFGQLVRRNQGRVFAVISRFLRDRAEAEDIAQEAFLRVFRKAGTYKPSARFSTWLYRIVANLCMNALRDRGRHRILQFGQEDPAGQTGPAERSLPDSSADILSQMQGQELQQAIGRAVENLPANQRLAIILRQYEAMSYEDIAKVMGCSTMAVKSLLNRARATLAQALQPYLSPGE